MSASIGAHNDHLSSSPREKQTWSCPLCTTVNDSEYLNCTNCCTGINPHHTRSLSNLMRHEQQKKIDESGLVERSLTRRVRSLLLYNKEDDWKCPVCTVRMPGWRNTCTSCGTNLNPVDPPQWKGSRRRMKSTGSVGILGSISGYFSGKKTSEANAKSTVDSEGTDSSLEPFVNIGTDSDGRHFDETIRYDIDNGNTHHHFDVFSDRAQITDPQSWMCSMCGAYNRIIKVQQKCYVCNIGEAPPAAIERVNGFGVNHLDQHPIPYGDTPLIATASCGQTDTDRQLLLSAANVDQEPLTVSVPVLPENWEVITSNEKKEQLYRHAETKREMSSPPSGYPLFKNASYPDVTFFDEPQETIFSSSGGHVDFENGVQITVPPGAIPSGTTVSVKVQPSFASKDVFVMPQDIRSASPSYFITGSNSELDGDMTLSLEHHVKLNTDDDAKDLLFLQADATPQSSDSASVYEYKEVPDVREEFHAGENRGQLTTRQFSFKFFKVGFRKRVRKLFTASKTDDPPEAAAIETPLPDPNRYTVRVYRSSSHTSGDRVAIVAVSLAGQLYAKFLEMLDTTIIPRDYPAVSSEAVDRTTLGPFSFMELQATLKVVSPPGWIVDPDREMIYKSEVDSPETNNFRPEELHDYPPKLVCRFYPEDHTPPRRWARCTLSFTGFYEEVKIHVTLKAPKIQRQVDTRILQEAAEKLRTTIRAKETRLVPTAETILSLMETMTTTLRSSSSLGDLAEHTDLIKDEVQSVIGVSRKVAEECSIQYIKADIEANLSMMEALSHQLCQVTKVKFKHCQDSSQEVAAINDLVISGANLLKAVDRLLTSVHSLNCIKGPSITRLTVTVDEIAEAVDIDPHQLDQVCSKADLLSISRLIPNWLDFSIALGLTNPERNGILMDNQLIEYAMKAYQMLDLWFKKKIKSHYRELVEAALNQCTPDHKLAADICKLRITMA